MIAALVRCYLCDRPMVGNEDRPGEPPVCARCKPPTPIRDAILEVAHTREAIEIRPLYKYVDNYMVLPIDLPLQAVGVEFLDNVGVEFVDNVGVEFLDIKEKS